MTDELTGKLIMELYNSNKVEDKLFAAACLKELGKIGQALYIRFPSDELKENILKIKKMIEDL